MFVGTMTIRPCQLQGLTDFSVAHCNDEVHINEVPPPCQSYTKFRKIWSGISFLNIPRRWMQPQWDLISLNMVIVQVQRQRRYTDRRQSGLSVGVRVYLVIVQVVDVFHCEAVEIDLRCNTFQSLLLPLRSKCIFRANLFVVKAEVKLRAYPKSSHPQSFCFVFGNGN